MNATQATDPACAVGRSGSDDAIDLQRITTGDSGGLTDLYDRHSAGIFGLALRITNDRSMAEDVVQEAFVSVWKNAARFDPARGSGRTWILAITHHRAIDAVRRRRGLVMSLDGEDGLPVWAPAGPDVWPEVSQRLDRAAVQLALAALPEVQRRSIELAYFGGLTQEEIAVATGAPLGTVKSRVRLGLLRLRKSLRQSDLEQGSIVTAI